MTTFGFIHNIGVPEILLLIILALIIFIRLNFQK